MTVRRFAMVMGVAFLLVGVLAVMGLIPAANMWNTFGLIPIHGHDVWLHAVIAAAAAYFGFVVPAARDEVGSQVHAAPRV